MESRYALREVQGAIGHDTRLLPDGRRADFRHTALHRALRRGYFELRDAMFVLHASLISASSLGSHARVDLAKAAEIVANDRRMFVKIAFPYADMSAASSEPTEQNYDTLMDELDAYIAKEKAELAGKSKGDAGSGSDGRPVIPAA